MPTKRIEYIDALRGFAMFLVVSAHIIGFSYKAEDLLSFNNIFSNFFLVLFFFVSGFCAYKPAISDNHTQIKKKFIQLVIPAFAFFTIYCLWRGRGLYSLLHITTQEYWFTVELFLFFVFYYTSNRLCKNTGKGWANVTLLSVAVLLYVLSFSHTLIEKTEMGATLFHYLGMRQWRHYIFFVFGVLAHKHFNAFEKFTDNPHWMALSVIGFFFMVFFAYRIDFPMWKPIRILLYGTFSIIVIFTFYRKHENSFYIDTKLGYTMQYIGRRTMDIYMIHNFLLPHNLDFMGRFFNNYNNPSIELLVTTIIALLVIFLSIVIGNIIRLSPTLSHWLLGEK